MGEIENSYIFQVFRVCALQKVWEVRSPVIKYANIRKQFAIGLFYDVGFGSFYVSLGESLLRTTERFSNSYCEHSKSFERKSGDRLARATTVELSPGSSEIKSPFYINRVKYGVLQPVSALGIQFVCTSSATINHQIADSPQKIAVTRRFRLLA